MKNNNTSLIVLAAGKGKRMKSDLPKVLHKIAGRTMLERTINILESIDHTQLIVVTNKVNNNNIQKLLGKRCKYVIQRDALGTAHAVMAAIEEVPETVKNIGVFYGDDTAFYNPKTIQSVIELHDSEDSAITFITVVKENPSGLGRIVRSRGKVKAIVEEKDATPLQLKIKEVNDGVYVFKKDWLIKSLNKLQPSRATGELYLTDLIEHALKRKQKVLAYQLKDEGQWHGINNAIELAEANLKISKDVHFMGISGAGSAGVAGIAEALGYDVTGCDINGKSPYSERLNIKIEKGHSPDHMEGISLLVVSPAILIYDNNNPELEAARKQGIPVLTWQEFQGRVLQKDKFVIAVAGAYGKSTTTAMIAKILIDAGLDPTCEIGARVLEWGSNFRVGKSKYYLCEADEYFDNFLNYSPDVSVILNFKWEHPDFFKTEEALINSYVNFAKNLNAGGKLIISKDKSMDKIRKALDKSINAISVGDFKVNGLSIIGDFRRENANYALTVAQVLKLDLEKAKKSVKFFKGLARRLEYKGKIEGVRFYDDYAVQPYTILKTANALKDKYKREKVLLVLEPHMHSRLSQFFPEFVSNLKRTNVDAIYITDVFAAREKKNKENIATLLAKKVGPKAQFTGSIKDSAKIVLENIKKYDIVCSMGAGDSYKLFELVRQING